MRHIAAALPIVLLIILTGCGDAVPKFHPGPTLAIRAASKPKTAAAPLKTEWKLPSGLVVAHSSIDVSSDRKTAVVWGERVGEKARKSCWLLDLETGEVEDLLDKSDGQFALVVGNRLARAMFSPDGARLLITEEGGKTAYVLELSTGKTIVVDSLEPSGVLWIGNRLLFSSWKAGSKICDLAGEVQERPKVQGRIRACDPTGTKLLVEYPASIVDPAGNVLRKFGGSACDKEVPLLSRSGNWAGVYCNVQKDENDDEENEWAYSVISTTTDEVLRLRRPWGATFALTDNGDSIFLTGEKNSTFGAVMTGGLGVQATTADVVFWPKDDDPWKSTEGAPDGPSFSDLVWNRMPQGKSQIIAEKAMALTLLGDELFFVEAEGDKRMLKAISLPETQASSERNASKTSLGSAASK